MCNPPTRKRLSPTERKAIYDKTNGHCAYCGCEITFKQMQADHVIPMDRYEMYAAIGQDIDTVENMLPACRSCNKYKHTFDIEMFRKQLERQPEILMRDNPTLRMAVRFDLVSMTPHPIVFYFEKEKDNG